MEQLSVKEMASRLIGMRGDILDRYPFFGRLLMRMPFGFAECGTAYTDMKKIVFDPEFMSRLDDEQLCFVVLHELMHCVLNHCTRGRGKLNSLYNIACDIVVNSILLEAMNLKKIDIDGTPAMHLSASGKEGRYFSAEEIYQELLKEAKEISGEDIIDNHEIWEVINDDTLTEEIWEAHIKKASKACGTKSGIPDSIERYIGEIDHTPKISWKQILHDYIQNDQCDYVFSKPDSRFSGDIVMPSFVENVEGSKVEKVFFFVDTSGSIRDTSLAEAFEEIKDAINQVGNMSGKLFFFDASVSEGITFESVTDINQMKPIGGGGTSFKRIFAKLSQYEDEEAPAIVIIMTDGYAEFPEETDAMGIPVVWLIIDSEVEAPWGECLHIYSD